MFQYDCDNNITLCKKHEKINDERHKLYKSALRWKQRVKSGQEQNDDEEKDHSYLMTVTEETETKGAAVLNDMIQTRKEIHLKQGSDITDIFGYQNTTLSEDYVGETEQVTLGVTEDRRKNMSQFDLAYIDVSGQEVLAAFDSCSTSTLIHRELIDEGKLEVTKTSSSSNINGIGGVAKGKVVEVKLHSRNKEKSIVINATVVDEIMQLKGEPKKGSFLPFCQKKTLFSFLSLMFLYRFFLF